MSVIPIGATASTGLLPLAPSVRDDVDALVEELNRDYALVFVGGKPLIVTDTEDLLDDETVRLVPEYLHLDTFRVRLANRFVWQGKRRIPAAQAWIESPARREYRGVVFDPTGRTPPDVLNLWRGFAVTPAARGTAARCERFLSHLYEQVADGREDRFAWITDWMARLVQRPGARTGRALVLRGGQGVGKSIVGEVLGSLFGAHYLPVSDARYVTGRFNAHLEHCVLLQLEEATWGGDHAAAGRLKDLVSGAWHLIERKGLEPVKMRNHVHLLITSNNHWVVPAGLDERRFGTFDVAEHRRQDGDYFGAIRREMREGGREALLRYLLDLPIPDMPPPIPETAALVEQQLASLPHDLAWWLDVLHRGALPGDRAGAGEVPRHVLYQHYIEHAQRIGVPRRLTANQIGQLLAKLVPGLESAHRSQLTAGGSRARVWTYRFPSLGTCREAFAARVGSLGDPTLETDPALAWDAEPSP